MFWIALAAAAQLSAPEPTNLQKWFSADDVPASLMKRGTGLWWVPIRLTIRPDGAIQSCEVESTSGIRELDSWTCRLAAYRGKFLPAHWVDGSVAFGVYRTSVRWVVADEPWDISKTSNPDLDVTVENLPRGAKSPALVRVMFAVEENGSMNSCEADPAQSLELAENNPMLVPVACDQIMKTYKAIPAKDLTGKAVRSVQNALVRFDKQH